MAITAETELCFYARITDKTGFEKAADKESHEQWEYLIPPREDGTLRGKIRIRATGRGSEVAYTETIKTPPKALGAVGGRQEHTVVIDKAYFDYWKEAFGTVGVFKNRFVFLSKDVTLDLKGEKIILPEVKFEVDVLLTPQGEHSKWCKIDVELDAVLAYLADKHADLAAFDLTVSLSSIPLGLEDAFSAEDMDEEHTTAVKNFWTKFSHPLTPEAPAKSE